MKIRKALLLLFSGICIPFLLGTCSDEPLVKPREELPPHTCEGKGTFGCLLNGQLYFPSGVMSPYVVYYDFRSNKYKGTFQLSAKRGNDKEAIRVNLYNQVFDTGYYKLGFDNNAIGSVRYSYITDSIDSYHCLSHMYGEMHMTGIDTVNRIVCGTFSFDAVNDKNNQDTVRIRDARFDARFVY